MDVSDLPWRSLMRRKEPVFQEIEIGDEVPPAEPMHARGLMHPLGITTLYGESNVGKGWVSCWVIRELFREGFLPTILDYESVQWEWRMRLYGMGFRRGQGIKWLSVDQAMGEHLVEPLRAKLWDIGTTHLIVDSASAARARVANADAGGQDAAMGIFRTLKDLGIPCLLLAHRAKAGTAGPLGSVQYRNQSSMVLRAEAEGAMATKVWVDDINDRPRPSGPFVFTRVPAAGGYTDVVLNEGKSLTLKADTAGTQDQAIAAIMKRLGRALTTDEVWRELKRDGWRNSNGVEPTPDVISSAMRKLAAKGLLIKTGRGRYAIPEDQSELPTDRPT